ncbi:uncharacterized protein EHS24_000077 [Apiotrichum porosum]|uniref:Uncharacterized protein n=1 Tax=Apiotrichum porosum TaxID=105984 RepID=A0A427Y9E1_9TREE|nr:uncharacterized protein EHS24_000077 [Apiotrichum porosum]RSH87567.1 hypothetical protein EHS24_000077 [Apiotrichum porosum]
MENSTNTPRVGQHGGTPFFPLPPLPKPPTLPWSFAWVTGGVQTLGRRGVLQLDLFRARSLAELVVFFPFPFLPHDGHAGHATVRNLDVAVGTATERPVSVLVDQFIRQQHVFTNAAAGVAHEHDDARPAPDPDLPSFPLTLPMTSPSHGMGGAGRAHSVDSDGSSISNSSSNSSDHTHPCGNGGVGVTSALDAAALSVVARKLRALAVPQGRR